MIIDTSTANSRVDSCGPRHMSMGPVRRIHQLVGRIDCLYNRPLQSHIRMSWYSRFGQSPDSAMDSRYTGVSRARQRNYLTVYFLLHSSLLLHLIGPSTFSRHGPIKSVPLVSQLVSELEISKTALTIFMIFCMKLPIDNTPRLTKPDFAKKCLFINYS